MTTKIRYDYEFLQQFCKENGIILTKDYSMEKVNRDTIIEAKCLTDGCEDICTKDFRNFVNIGCYCKIHTEKIKQKNRESTCLKKYGFKHPMCVEKIKNKVKNTSLEKYGVEHIMFIEGTKTKIKNTCLEKYGVEYSLQSKEVREKSKQTCLEKYGVENPLKSQTIMDKLKATNVEKYGVENPFQNEEVKEKIKNRCLEKYGVEYSLQSKEVREKSKQTCLEKYGVEFSCQDPNVSEKASKNAYKVYDYTFPSGRVERIQGYEKFTLNDLLQKEAILEDDIVVKRSDVPSVWYEDATGKKHRYFVDCFIKSQNRCIEAKSTWTAAKKKDCIYLKQHALKDAGYKCEIWIYNGKGEIVEKVF